MSTPQASIRPFTGRHMALIMVSFFLVVVTVNVTMAMLAQSSWTGLVVKNSYIASQTFNTDTARREAMLARGYQLAIAFTANRLELQARDKAGQPLPVISAKAVLNRSVESQEVVPVVFACALGHCTAEATLDAGLWRGDIQLDLSGKESWQQPVEILVKEK